MTHLLALLRHWLVISLAFFFVLAAWALAAPVGSAPDDDYHLASIWCAQGEQPGRCVSDPSDPDLRLVPVAVVNASECFRFEKEIPAACMTETLADDRLVPTPRVNQTAGLYPGGFYSVMGLLVGPDVERSVHLMRLLSAALGALVLAALLRLTPLGVSSAGSVAIIATFVPLGLFTVASTNPSSWTLLSIATVWAFAWSWLRHPRALDRRGVLLAGATVGTALMALTSRVDANAYLVLALVLAVILAGWRHSRTTLGRALVLSALAVVAGIVYLTHSPVDVVGVAGPGEALGTAESGAGLLLSNLVELPSLWIGAVGDWPLGWVDTVMPTLVPVVGILVIGGLLLHGLGVMWPRKAVVAGLAAAALVAVPMAFLYAQRLLVGQMIQPRYVLPLLTLTVAMTLLGVRAGRPLWLQPAQAWAIGTGLVISATLAFWVNLHRYAFGAGIGLLPRSVAAAWSPPVPMLALLSVAALAGTVLVAGILARTIRASAAR